MEYESGDDADVYRHFEIFQALERGLRDCCSYKGGIILAIKSD